MKSSRTIQRWRPGRHRVTASEAQPTPPNPAVGLAIQLIINGDGSFHYGPQNDIADRTASGPVTVIGTHNTVTGLQTVQAGRDATVTPAQDQPSREGWWARLRKRGMIVAAATIIGAIAVVIAAAIAICTWIGWTP